MSDRGHGEKEIEKSFARPISEKRRREERRRQPSNGFARISIVGWICRREKLRRRGNPGHIDAGDA